MIINENEGLVRFCNNKDLFLKFIVKFINNEEMMKEIKANFDHKDYDKLYFNVHTLKGIVGNLSLSDLYDDTCWVVDKLRKGEYDIDESFCKMMKTYDLTISYLKEKY